MPNLLSRILSPVTAAEERQLTSMFQTWPSTSYQSPEKLTHSFVGYALEGYMGSGPVFSLIARRMLTFSEVGLTWRNRRGELFGSQALIPLEQPWPNGTQSDLLALMELDVSLAGNSYTLRVPGTNELRRLRPDWVEIAGTEELGVIGYFYTRGGPQSGNKPELFLRDDVAHYAPYPDPLAMFKGMSWLTPVAREVDADTRMSRHKIAYFDNAATPNGVLKLERKIASEDERQRIRAEFERRYSGSENAFKTVILEGGADFTVVGGTMRTSAFTEVQAAGEARLASAAGVPPIIVGFSEGLDAATYSNYGQARRAFGDMTMRPLWKSAVGALDTIVDTPPGAKLWYDASEVAFLQADEQDEATIRATNASTIRQLVDGGFTPDSVVLAVTTGDFTRLEHTDLFSVQLQPPGTVAPAIAPDEGVPDDE